MDIYYVTTSYLKILNTETCRNDKLIKINYWRWLEWLENKIKKQSSFALIRNALIATLKLKISMQSF